MMFKLFRPNASFSKNEVNGNLKTGDGELLRTHRVILIKYVLRNKILK